MQRYNISLIIKIKKTARIASDIDIDMKLMINQQKKKKRSKNLLEK